MRFAIYDHAGKSHYLRQKLLEAGHILSEQPEGTDVILLDCDWPWAHPRPALIDAAVSLGSKVVLYPHGGPPTVFNYDGICEPNEWVAMRLEHGQGSLDMAAAFGRNGDLNQHATGWLFCPTEPFQPVKKIRRLLFAPMHPNIEQLQKGTNGHDPAAAINQAIYRQLLGMRVKELVVSIVAPAHHSGVWQHPRTRLVRNDLMQYPASYELIRTCDAVVATGTIAYTAVALGKPTVMFHQAEWADYVGGHYRFADHADDYADIARYPLDVEDGPLPALLKQACTDDVAADWRARWIGDDGTDNAVRLLEQLTPETQKNVTIIGATAAAGTA